MSTTNNTQQQSSTNAENWPTNSQNSTLITHKVIENTPFHLTGNEEKGYFIRMGDYRLTDYKKTPEEAEEELYYNQWNIMLTLIAAVIHYEDTRHITLLP